jgi:hypothetical protein
MSEEPEVQLDDILEKPTRSKKARDVIRRRVELQDLRDVLSTAMGRRVVMRLLELTGVHRATYTGEPLSGAYNEGMRSVGLFLRDEALEADANQFVLAEVEHRRKEDEGNA